MTSKYIQPKEQDRNLFTSKNTKLSRKLSQGKVDPRALLKEINQTLKKDSLSEKEKDYLNKTKRQLVMREFARAALSQQKYKQPKGMKGKNSPEYRKLVAGKTGVPSVDASVQALKEGYPPNRSRLLLARYAIRNLNLDPEVVSDFFKKHLKDYSPVLNTFNIVQAASGATFAEPYFRKSNPITAAKKLDPKGEWIKSKGFDPDKIDTKAIDEINKGHELWMKRWKGSKGEGQRISKNLYPTRDPDKGIFFLQDKRAKGRFAPFYRDYLKEEEELLKDAVIRRLRHEN